MGFRFHLKWILGPLLDFNKGHGAMWNLQRLLYANGGVGLRVDIGKSPIVGIQVKDTTAWIQVTAAEVVIYSAVT